MAASTLFDESTHRTDLLRIPARASLRYTDRFCVERLNEFRLQGDPAADFVAAELHSKHGGLTKIHDLLTTVQAKATDPAQANQVFRDFLAQSAVIPDWADRAMVERGQRVHATHLPFIGLSLFSGSLVGGGQFITSAVVTALAGNITTDPTRRIDETGMLLNAIALPGSLVDAGMAAHDSLTRVRLLHGALRHWLPRSGRLNAHKRSVPEHIYVEGEVPINQQDLAITLGIFCYVNLRSLRRMGIVLSQRDVDCYVHMWRYAGHVLGICDELLPKSIEDQEEFMLCSMLHQGAPDHIRGPDTKKFIDAFVTKFTKLSKGLIPFEQLQTFLYQMTRYLNGGDYTTGMEIENLGNWHWSICLIRALGGVFGTVLPRMPFGEEALFRLHTRKVTQMLRQRGTPTGHAAGSGGEIQIVADIRSKL